MTRQRSPRLPRHRMSPGQMALWNQPTLTVLLPTGRSLQLLQGGRAADPRPTTPVVAVGARRQAA